MHMHANSQPYDHFFTQPTDLGHRRYEALRAVFVEQQPLQQVAQRFGVSYGTVRNWTSSFRGTWDRGEPPPFSPRRRGDGRLRPQPRKMNPTWKSPTRAPCR